MARTIDENYNITSSEVIKKYNTCDKVLSALVRNGMITRKKRDRKYIYSKKELEEMNQEFPFIFNSISKAKRELSGKIAQVITGYDEFYDMPCKRCATLFTDIEKEVSKYLKKMGIADED